MRGQSKEARGGLQNSWRDERNRWLGAPALGLPAPPFEVCSFRRALERGLRRNALVKVGGERNGS